MSFNSAIRSGSKPIRMLTKYWKALNPQEVFSTVFHNPILRVAGSLLSPLLWYKTRVQKLRNRSVTVQDVNDVKILENVYHRWRQTDKIHTIRDEKYLTWRFKSHPEIVYQFLAAYVGQEVRGYFVISVTEFMGMKRGTIVDYLVVNDDPDIFEPLLNYALHVFKANSCALIDAWVFTQRWAQQAIEDYGFLSSRNILLRRWLSKTYLVARPVDERNFPHNLASFDWYITPSDSDAY